tara:strand:- start:777 stop:1040 length:264 start_codon:yes stop_codon:yes gene_type:complete
MIQWVCAYPRCIDALSRVPTKAAQHGMIVGLLQVSCKLLNALELEYEETKSVAVRCQLVEHLDTHELVSAAHAVWVLKRFSGELRDG